MTKAKAPKVVKEKKVKVGSASTETVTKAKAPKEFGLVVKLNDQVFETETDNLAEAIQSFAPEFLRTKLIIQVTKDGKTLERLLYLQDGKRLFNNRIALESLIKNLIF